MKIALVNTYTHGGAANACLRIGEALLSEGANVTLITRDNSEAAYVKKLSGWSSIQAKAGFYLERLTFLPHEKSKKVRFSFSLANFGANLSKLPSIQNADIINIHWINQGFLSLKNLEQLGKLGKPIVWTMHDMWPFTGGCHYARDCKNYIKSCGNCLNYLNKPKSNDLSNVIWKRKAALFPQLPLTAITPSVWLKNIAKNSSLFKEIDVRSIPNSVDSHAFRPIKQVDARGYFKLPKNKKLALFVAMNVNDKRKGFDSFQESLNKLDREELKDLELIVVGMADPNIFNDLPFNSHYLGLLKGNEALMNAYNAADFFIIPSLEDNLPNTVIESLACGKPVLGFNTGGIPDMVIHEQTGYLANYKDTDDLAKGIKYLYNHGETLQKACREKVLKDYTYESVAKQYLQFFEELLHGSANK